MSLLSSLLVTLGRILTYVQLILYLPLALDLAGEDCFNALSASLAIYYFNLSTIRLITRNTKWSPLASFLSIFQFIVVPACLLISFNLYSPPENSYFGNSSYTTRSTADTSTTTTGQSKIENAGSMAISLFRSSSSKSSSSSLKHSTTASTTAYDHQYTSNQTLNFILSFLLSFLWWSLTRVPSFWSTLLRMSSPLFSLLEGISTLLVIQSLGSTSRWIIARSLSSPPPPPNRRRLLSYFPSFGLGGAEGWQLLFLVLSAFIYVFSALALYLSFEGATKGSAGIAAAVGVSISSTFWLTAIAFGVRKGNVVETSLMLAYVVFNVCTLDSLSFTALEDPLTLIRSFKVESFSASSNSPRTNFLILKSSAFLSPFVIEAITSLIKIVKLVLGQSLDFISAAGNALPKSVIVSLIYRLTILYASSRILPGLKKSVENNGGGRDGNLSRANSQLNLKLNSENGIGIGPRSELEGEEIKEKVQQGGLERRRSFKEDETESESSSSDSESETGSDSDSEEENDDRRLKKIRNGSQRHSKSKASKSKSKSNTKHRQKKNKKKSNNKRNQKRYSDSEDSSTSSSSVSTSTTSSSTSTTTTTSSSTESETLKSERRRKWRRQSLLKKGDRNGRSKRDKGGNSKVKTLREEESFGTFISIIVSYSRLILIAVYSHLLMLDQSHKVYWRFLTIGITLSLWSMELILGREDSELGFK